MKRNFKGEAAINVCDKIVRWGLILSGGAYLVELVIAGIMDFRYRKDIKNRAKNG